MDFRLRCFSRIRLIAVALALSVFAAPLHADNPRQGLLSQTVKIGQSVDGKYSLKGSLRYLVTDDKTTLDDVVAMGNEAFDLSTGNSVNIGFSKQALWLSLDIENTGSETEALLLVVDLPVLNSIVFYDGLEQAPRFAGIEYANRDNSRSHRLPNFSFLLEPYKKKTLWLKVNSNNGFVPLSLWQESAFADYSHDIQLVEGMYFGMMFLVALYNFLLYFSVKDKAYLYYVLYIVTFSVTISMLNGYALEYFPELVAKLYIDALFFLVVVQTCFLVVFTRYFLSINDSMPFINMMLGAVFKLLCFSLVLQALLPMHLFALVLPVVSSFASTVLLIIGSYCLYKGSFLARYYMLSWTAVLIGVLLYVLKLFDVLPDNYFIQNGIQIGSAIEVVLQSLGLAAKFKYMKQDNDAAQQQALINQITANYQLEEKVRERTLALEQLTGKLAKYLSPQVYNSIFEGDNDVHVQTRRKKLTIFFSDIKGFTEITDSLESEVLSHLLNNYLDEMAQIALRHGGTVDKFIGDAVMVFFGDPQSNGDKADALACVRMAIEMRERMIDLRLKWQNEGIAYPLHIRCGVNTGFCTVGNFGSENRMDYTIVGGQVNLASRLESSAAMDQILISHETYSLIKDEIFCEYQGEVRVKGIHHPVKSYQVVDTYDYLNTSITEFYRDIRGFNLAIDLREVDRETVLQQLREAMNHLSRTSGGSVKRPFVIQGGEKNRDAGPAANYESLTAGKH